MSNHIYAWWTPQLWWYSTVSENHSQHHPGQARLTTCPGLPSYSPCQRVSCLGTPGRSPAFHIQVRGQETGANSWRCAEGAWRLPQQMNHHRLIFNSRLLLPSSISASFLFLYTTFSLRLVHQFNQNSWRYVNMLAYTKHTRVINMRWIWRLYYTVKVCCRWISLPIILFKIAFKTTFCYSVLMPIFSIC